jgi:tetratricopeptide (TPR) repeat protein
VLEDLHWAVKASLALIDELLTDARDDISVMVLILARPAMEHRFPGHESFTKISLHELDDKQSSELLLRLCNIESLPTRIEKQILHKTEGNPFYVEEIVLHLRELGMLVEKAGKWRLTGDLDAIEIPETVQGLILARVDRLAVHVRRVLQVASVIGHTFRYRVLEHVAEAQARLENLLSELVDVEYIFERSALPELVYLFKHVVTQEVVYNTLLRRRRSAFHAKVADAVELLYQGRLEEHCELLAHHWYLAGDLAKSRHYLWQAGQKCQRMYANEAAIDFYTKLLGVLDKGELDESERRRLRVETLNELGIVNKIVGDYEASRGHFLAAAEIAAKSEALKPQTAVAERRVGDVLRLMGQLRDASKHLERAAALFEELRDRPAVRGIHQALGVVAQARGKYDTALEHFEAYLKALGQEDGDLHRAYLGHANVGIIHMLRGDLKRAKTHGEKALSIAEEQSDRRAMSEGHHQLSLIALRRGDFDDAKTHSVEAYRLAHDIGYQRVQLMADASMSEIYNFTGELPAAIHHARRAVDFATEHRHADVLALARGNWARSLHLREDHAEAIAMAEQALRDATQFEDHVCQVNALLVLADSHLALGDREEAVRAAREAVKMVEENEDQDMRAQAHRTLAECLSEEGANGEISTLLRSALKAAEAKGDPHDLAWVQYSRARLLKSADTRREALSSARKLAKKLGVAPLLKRLEASPA